MMMDRQEEAAVFHEGVALFNAGDFFDAHEAWEDIWTLASGPRKAFYQGLIQYAVTLEHVRRGNPRGVRSVWASCQSKFVGLPDVYMGIRIPALLSAMQSFLQPIFQMPAWAFDPATPRGQALPVDLAQAPRITLMDDPFAQ